MNADNIKSFFLFFPRIMWGEFLPNSWRQCVSSLWGKESFYILWFYFSLRVHLFTMGIEADGLSFVSAQSHDLYHETGPPESPWIMQNITSI